MHSPRHGKTEIRTHVFPNGFRVVYEPPENRMKITHVNVLCHVGSAFEPSWLRGVSHFIEHMCFKGTRHLHTMRDIIEQYDTIGAYFNAYTDKQYTCYVANFHSEYTKHCLSILGDITLNSVFERKEYEKEMNVVVEENKRNTTDYGNELYDLTESMIYNGTAYQYPVDTMKYHKKVDVWKYDDVIGFYHKYYVPENMVLSIVSPIPFSRILRWLKQTDFVRHKTVPVVRPILNLIPESVYSKIGYSDQHGIRIETMPVDIETAYISISFRTCNMFSPDVNVLTVLRSILGGSLTSRLYTILREKNGLTYTSSVSINHYESMGHIMFMAITDSTKILENRIPRNTRTKRSLPKRHTAKNKPHPHKKGVLPLMLELIKDLVKRGVSTKEIANVKTQMKGKYEMGLENAENQVSHNGKRLLLYDNTHITPYKYMYDTYAEIAREDINRVIAKYFKPENMNIAMVGGKLPKSESIQQMSMRIFE